MRPHVCLERSFSLGFHRNIYPIFYEEDDEDETGSESGGVQTGPSMRSKIFQSLLDEEAEYSEEECEYNWEDVEDQGEPVTMPSDVAPSRHSSPTPRNDLPTPTQTGSPAALIPAVPPPPKTAANLGLDDVIEIDDDVIEIDDDVIIVDNNNYEV